MDGKYLFGLHFLNVELLTQVAAFCVALAVALYMTPLFREAAIKFGIVDKPSTPLKTHKQPVPYLGGLSVYVAVVFSLTVSYNFNQDVLGILLGGTGMVVLGLMDDFGVLTPRVKLFWQFVAVTLLIKAGIYIKLGFLPSWLNIALTFLWIVGCINAVNIIDIMDGLASTVTSVSFVTLFGFALWCGRPMVATMALAAAGASIGFLYYNRPPAKIYLGDTGSMFLGFMLGALSINNAYTRYNNIAAVAPVLIAGIPVFDTAFVSVVRILKGKNPMHGSPDHFALRLRKVGLTVRKTVAVAVVGQILLSAAAIAASLNKANVAMIVVAATLALLIIAGVLLARVNMDRPMVKAGKEESAEQQTAKQRNGG